MIKQMLKSKTILFNAIVGSVVTFLKIGGIESNPEVVTGILTVGNFILRLITKEAIKDK